MNRRWLKSIIFLCELIIVYGVLWFLQYRGITTPKFQYLILCFAGLIFTLYYGIRGAIGAVTFSGLFISLFIGQDFFVFLTRNYLESSFYLVTILITGFVRSGIELKTTSTDLTNKILQKRIETLSIDLSEKDRALRDAFHEVLTDMESPRIMYQALRRLSDITDNVTLCDEILYVLYAHCHAEKSSIYEPVSKDEFRRVSSFGSTSLPDVLKWKADDMPEIMRVVVSEQEVIIPREFGNKLVMAIPILSSSEQLRYIILIEEIRFINLSEDLIDLLKITSFWVKHIIEHQLYREEMQKYSQFASVVVYRPDVAPEILKRNIARYKRHRLPFQMLYISGSITERLAKRLSGTLRLYDELYMLKASEMVLFLSMTEEQYTHIIVKRLESMGENITIRRHGAR